MRTIRQLTVKLRLKCQNKKCGIVYNSIIHQDLSKLDPLDYPECEQCGSVVYTNNNGVTLKQRINPSILSYEVM